MSRTAPTQKTLSNAPEGIRTPNPWFRRPKLYPIELQAHVFPECNRHSRPLSTLNHRRCRKRCADNADRRPAVSTYGTRISRFVRKKLPLFQENALRFPASRHLSVKTTTTSFQVNNEVVVKMILGNARTRDFPTGGWPNAAVPASAGSRSRRDPAAGPSPRIIEGNSATPRQTCIDPNLTRTIPRSGPKSQLASIPLSLP
jgi:hypothetical protein